MLVLDCSWARPSPAAIRSAGYSGVIRYLSYEPAKDLSIAERDAYWAEGLTIGLVWEAVSSAPLQGYERGVSDAREANRRADALGWPGDVVIVYATDFDVTGAQLPAVRDYYRGAKAVGRRPVGAYGPDHLLDDLGATQPVACYWQCASWSGTGEGTGGSIYVPAYGRNVQLSRQACLFQFYGSVRLPETDHNESTGHAGRHLLDLMYHPEGHAPEPEEDPDMIKAVYLPDEPEGPKFWQPRPDLTRVPYEDLPEGTEPARALAELAMTMKIGAVQPEVATLQGLEAELFKARYWPLTLTVAHWGAVQLMVTGSDRTIEGVTKAIGEDQIAVDASITDADVQRIAEATADEQYRRLAE